jgi:hypothetical protein
MRRKPTPNATWELSTCFTHLHIYQQNNFISFEIEKYPVSPASVGADVGAKVVVGSV